MSPIRRSVAAAASLALMSACAHERLPPGAAIPLDAVPFAWGTGGTFHTTIALSPDDRAAIRAAFTPAPTDGVGERRAIASAVHRMQLAACRQTPVRHARGYSEVDSDGQGRMDCVDCSTATTVFLRVLDQQGLLRRHEVMEPLWRYAGGVVPVHRSAVIRERATGERFAVDPWLGPYSEPPRVIPLERWKQFEDDAPGA